MLPPTHTGRLYDSSLLGESNLLGSFSALARLAVTGCPVSKRAMISVVSSGLGVASYFVREALPFDGSRTLLAQILAVIVLGAPLLALVLSRPRKWGESGVPIAFALALLVATSIGLGIALQVIALDAAAHS
jgi:hypothetical protein